MSPLAQGYRLAFGGAQSPVQLYGGFVAFYAKDTKYVIGYSSSSHMGYVFLGMAAVVLVSSGIAIMLALYIPLGYYMDRFFWRRRQRILHRQKQAGG
jgi:formate hydrogenlyase subunit 3/multisubunit Na+/H+ antiporter MnhD subunit